MYAAAEGTTQRETQERVYHDRTERDGSKSGPDRPVCENYEDSENRSKQCDENQLLAPQQTATRLVACKKGDLNPNRRQVIGKSVRRRDKRRRQGCRLE